MTKLSRANLATQDSTVLLQDNTTNDILPSEHRQSNVNIHDSFLSLVDDNIDKDADTSLKYLSDPSGAWDSSITHDLKLTPKIYVDDLVNASLSGYAKLDGTNMPFTGQIKSLYSPSALINGFEQINNNPNSYASIYLKSDVDYGGLASCGSSFPVPIMRGKTILLSYTGMVITTNANVTGGGASPLEFMLGGSNRDVCATMYPSQFPNTLILAKAIVVGDSTTTTAGALRYNTSTNKHQGYDGTTWNDLY